MRQLYEGMRLGGQELQGAIILDPQNALFKDEWLIHDDVAEDLIEQVTVVVDPSGGTDEVGIVASALLNDGRFALLAVHAAGVNRGGAVKSRRSSFNPSTWYR